MNHLPLGRGWWCWTASGSDGSGCRTGWVMAGAKAARKRIAGPRTSTTRFMGFLGAGSNTHAFTQDGNSPAMGLPAETMVCVGPQNGWSKGLRGVGKAGHMALPAAFNGRSILKACDLRKG